jgi:7,8-dihydroneopterin aldolase/epimerase/oxygenase
VLIGSGDSAAVKTPARGFRYSSGPWFSTRPRMDLIYIRNLRIDCVIGVFEWERRVRQSVVIDLDLAADIARAARTDRLDDTLDYKAIAKRLVDFVGQSQFQLVETLAEKVAETVLHEFSVRWVRVRINKKGALRQATDVGVVIERGQQS